MSWRGVVVDSHRGRDRASRDSSGARDAAIAHRVERRRPSGSTRPNGTPDLRRALCPRRYNDGRIQGEASRPHRRQLMKPITRRDALVLGGAGTAAVVVGVTGLLLTNTEVEFDAGDEFSQPEYLTSSDGELAIELVAGSGARSIGGRTVTTLEYNGSLPGPTIAVRAGDRLRINLRNDLTEPTNLHVHGLHVSPEGRGDNVLRSVAPGESFEYEYEIPADHPPGVYWYHPHVHGSVADQVFGGLYGAIVVEDAAADAPRGRPGTGARDLRSHVPRGPGAARNHVRSDARARGGTRAGQRDAHSGPVGAARRAGTLAGRERLLESLPEAHPRRAACAGARDRLRTRSRPRRRRPRSC